MDYEKIGKTFIQFIETIKALRTPETGCPWDLEQDHKSLRPYLLEEAHEVLQTIDANDDPAFCEELGDLLLQVVLHAQIADDRGAFDIEQIIRGVNEKMIRRHPHVFGDAEAATSGQVLENWERIKAGEKSEGSRSAKWDGGGPAPLAAKLRDVPQALPALVRAQRIGEKAAKSAFDWSGVAGVWAKVNEELKELETELEALPELSAEKYAENRARCSLPAEQQARLEHELGDLLFSICQLARWLGIHSEDALRISTERFLGRFERMERNLTRPLDTFSEDELEAAWQQAKRESP